MILKKIGDRHFVVNLLADFILDKLGKDSSSSIVVADFNNFMVIKGKTDIKEPIDISKVVSEFNETYSEILSDRKIKSTIDLIEYDCKMDEVSKLTTTLHNTDNCSYHYKQIESFSNDGESVDFDFVIKTEFSDLVCMSHFPHGYSLNQGRSIYYYSKRIMYSIPSNYPTNSITITIDKNEKEDSLIEVYNNFDEENDSVLKSSILDQLDFNFDGLDSEMKKMDWSFELTNPLEDFNILKEIKKLEII